MKRAVSIVLMSIVVCFTASALAADAPIITLDSVEVAAIQPFFVKPRVEYKDEKEPGRVESAGSIMSLAYVLSIKNPTKGAFMLDELTFTACFDGIEVNTAMVYEDSWIPAGKTNQLRVVVTNESLPTLLSLSVGAENAERLKEMKTGAGAIVKKWWETVGDFAFPVTVTGGTALFKDEKGKEVRVTFTGAWPEKKAEEKK
jgi:hypothetical protein